MEATLDMEDEDYLEYSFDSAWSPPIDWLRKVAGDYPKLSFKLRYIEEGIGFMGVATARDGKVVDNCISC